MSDDGKSVRHLRLGTDFGVGEQPQAVVPRHVWQAARSLGAWTLVGCTVSPGFEFKGFELAPPDWKPLSGPRTHDCPRRADQQVAHRSVHRIAPGVTSAHGERRVHSSSRAYPLFRGYDARRHVRSSDQPGQSSSGTHGLHHVVRRGVDRRVRRAAAPLPRARDRARLRDLPLRLLCRGGRRGAGPCHHRADAAQRSPARLRGGAACGRDRQCRRLHAAHLVPARPAGARAQRHHDRHQQPAAAGGDAAAAPRRLQSRDLSRRQRRGPAARCLPRHHAGDPARGAGCGFQEGR